MSILIKKPSLVQILISYSKERKQEMREGRETSCQGLVNMVKDAIKMADGKIIRVQTLGKGFADLLIEGSIESNAQLDVLQEAMKKINKDVGAEQVYLAVQTE